MAAVLGGLDTLVFTAGIGDQLPRRSAGGFARAWSSWAFASMPAATKPTPPVISRDGSPVTVRVMKTDEELMIARHTYKCRCIMTG